MKVRNGFVSNSSSSSFVLVTTKLNFDKVYEGLDIIEKKIVDFISKDVGKFLNTDLKKIHYCSGNYDSFEDFDLDLSEEEKQSIMKEKGFEDEDELDEYLEDIVYENLEKIEEKLQEGECICHGEEM